MRGKNRILGLDIGGANTKAVSVRESDRSLEVIGHISKYFPIWEKSRKELPHLLQQIGEDLNHSPTDPICASITAELSDAYMTKREGIFHIVSSLQQAFPSTDIFIFTTEGTFKRPQELLQTPLKAAAANWVATGRWVASLYPNCILVDIGSTTTDIIPIIKGNIAAAGRTDLTRLLHSELVYTGVLRATIPSISHHVPFQGKRCPISFEKFSTMADVHLILGNITEDQYTSETADGRPPTREFSISRLGRTICADTEEISQREVEQIATYLYRKQVQQIAKSLGIVAYRFEKSVPFILTGLGAKFLGIPAGKRVIPRHPRQFLMKEAGGKLDSISSAFAVAWCLWRDFPTQD